MSKDVLIGIDAGTSVIKSVAFSLSGQQIAVASTPNNYTVTSNGAASQSLSQTWKDCAHTLQKLHELIPELANRTAAISVTGQGDGTWLVGKHKEPITDGWLWLDARSGATADRLRMVSTDRERFKATGTGLNCCQMGPQLAFMSEKYPEYLEKAEVAFHAKDWLYLNLTDQRVTDPSEACFTFGNFRTRDYDNAVIGSLGLTDRRHLFPEIIDGTQVSHPLTDEAAQITGLLAGTPVVLGFVDVVCTGLGAGIYTGEDGVGCTILGTTGIHMLARKAENVSLNAESTGYVMLLPIPDMVAQLQTNMAATLNIEWLLKLAADLISEFGKPVEYTELIGKIDGWLEDTKPANIMYHPYISEAGERGPFINANARASFMGLNSSHRFPELVRAVIDGLAMASRDCYSAMGAFPREVRLSGGAAKSRTLRNIISSSLNTSVRCSSREEAGAAGAAMMAAVSIGIYPDMTSCINEWVTPMFSKLEDPDVSMSERYNNLYKSYQIHKATSKDTWDQMVQIKEQYRA